MEQLDLNIQGQSTGPKPNRSTVLKNLPLAARMRPVSFDEYCGQEHILSDGKLLRRAIDSDSFSSIILSGPPGVGKTTLAELIARSSNSAFIRLSGVVSTVSDIRKEIKNAVTRQMSSDRKTILFIDEIHRFNRAQQDVLLPDVENGNIRLVGATTQNPNFYVIGPLLSRSLVFQLETLGSTEIKEILNRALISEKQLHSKLIHLTEEAMNFISETCDGDARKALNALEIAITTTPANSDGKIHIDMEVAKESIQKKSVNYGDDEHYDCASAFIKSMRGSDPDAAVYWLAKMLHAGEEIRFIARRMVIFASEDIGNADPRAITLTVNAMQAVDMIGLPEAGIILSQAATYCATAPKSNASYKALRNAQKDIETQRTQCVPKHLRDPHSSTSRLNDKSDKYLYPHDFKNNYVTQEYLGVDKRYYVPGNIGYEVKINERMDFWSNLRKKN